MKRKTFKSLPITGIATKGKALARTEEGLVVFVQGGVPGDIADVEVFKKRRNYAEGRVAQLTSPSPDRIDPVCEHFGVCGGCQWQYMDYQAQLRHKQQEVTENLVRIGGVQPQETTPILGSKNVFGYRNKMEYSFSNRRWLTQEEIQGESTLERNALGFHKPGMWDKVVDINRCHLQAESANAIRNFVRDYSITHHLDFFDHKNKSGFLRTMMIRNTSVGQWMVVIQFFKEDPPIRTALLDALVEAFPQINSLHYVINSKPNDSIYDQDIICYHGKPFIEEQMEDLVFRITPKAFYQTNSEQAYELYKIVRKLAQLTGSERVYDLYTGLGTIAQFVAKDAAYVVGIESVPEAIAAAKENAARNQIQNTFFEVGDMKRVFNDDFVARHGQPDVIITDPPRDGMHKDVVKQLLKLSPKRIVYVSCNPATQARDLAMMSKDYKLVEAQPVDMFPHTQHVENVVLLERIHG
jgi:23S rRNA (uracil1939-C5)-methyltransferase